MFKISDDKAHLFDEFFSEFDERMNELDIISYGISMTTLEEVFIASNAEAGHKDPVAEAALLPEPNKEL